MHQRRVTAVNCEFHNGGNVSGLIFKCKSELRFASSCLFKRCKNYSNEGESSFLSLTDASICRLKLVRGRVSQSPEI